MMALSVSNPPTTPRRVKVYELRNNDWFDRGTGYCTGQLVNVRLSRVCLVGATSVELFSSLNRWGRGKGWGLYFLL